MNTEEIAESIEIRLIALRDEIGYLQAARAALQNGDPIAAVVEGERSGEAAGARPNDLQKPVSRVATRSRIRARRGRVAPRARRHAKRPRSAGVVAGEQLELALSEHGELSSAALAELVAADRGQVLVLLRELEDKGRVARIGQRRGTRWRPITDEERIQRRAAELEALSRRGRRS